jgi:two-component system sensor histidine kinase YesM
MIPTISVRRLKKQRAIRLTDIKNMLKITDRFRQLKIQISLYYATIILLTIIFIGFSAYVIFSNILINQTSNSVKTSIENSGKYMEAYIDKIYGLANLMVNDQKLIHYITENDPSLKAALLHDIETVIESDDFIKSIIIITHDGRLISNENTLTIEMSQDMMQESWYKKALHSMPYLSATRMNNFTMNKDAWVISVSREIVDGNNQNMGVMLIDIDYQFVNDHIIDMDIKQSSNIFIMDCDNRLVYHKDTSYFTDFEKQAALLTAITSNEAYDKKTNLLTTKYQIENANWVLVSTTPLSGLINLKRDIFIDLSLISISLLILVIIASNLFAKNITNPIKHLEEAMRDNHQSVIGLAETNHACSEVKSLTKHYNDMIDRINLLIAENKDKEQRLRESEIDVLTSQINPHFLYNTLDTILWMAEAKNTDDVIDLTKALGSFFRLSLSGGALFVPIKNEIKHVEEYLFIQKKRYGEKLTYSFDIDNRIMMAKVPKIILQPIVENAIYHGIRELDGSGHIHIQGTKNGDFIYFVITDNGVGFNTKQVTIHSQNLALSGLGIKNIDERLKLYFCESCGVSITSEVGKGTQVTLTIRSTLN